MKMMFLEHVIVALVFSIIAAGVFTVSAVAVQFIDIDHVLNSTSEATFYQKFNRALDSLPLATSDGYFEEGSRGLHRGFLHRPVVFFGFVYFTIACVGLSVGWFLHLVSDGVEIVVWNGL